MSQTIDKSASNRLSLAKIAIIRQAHGTQFRERIMKCTRANITLLIVSILLVLSVSAEPEYDPLPSWKNTPVKLTIQRFVAAVSDPNNASYVPFNRRIAVVDKDGTLVVEKPLPASAMFGIERLRILANRRPTLASQEAYAAATENNLAYFIDLHGENFSHWLKVIINAFSGMPQELFTLESRIFFNKHLHPDFKVSYRDLVYQPMMELLNLLERHRFKVFLVTGSASGFVRGMSQQVYEIPAENVIGSSVEFKYTMTNRGSLLIRRAQNWEPSNVHAGKPINIQRHIGQRPILAIGNSDGDLEMFEFTTVGHAPSLALLIHHDDDEREYAYDDGATKVLTMAPNHGWAVVSMKQDFRTIFRFKRQ